MKTKYLVLIAAFVLSILGGLGYSAFHYHGKSVEASKDLTQAKADLDSSERITGNVIRTMNLFSDIAKANEDAKQKNANDSEQARVVYKAILAKSACAGDVVGRDVADGLYKRANKIRSGTSSADTGQPDS